MRYSLLLLFFISQVVSAQSTFFIKYKSEAPQSYVNEKVSSKKVFDDRLLKTGSPEYNVNYLARGIALQDEVLGRIIKVHFTSGDFQESEIVSLLNDPLVEYVQEGRTYKIDYTPNDSLLSSQWALEKIKAYDAWDISEGSDTVLLAIIDTGIDYFHPDLKNKIKFNEGESGTDSFGADKRSNGIDDDRNGFIDDYMGWDFTDRLGFPFDSTGGDYLNWDNDPADYHGHGTWVAGTSAAETNNLIGVAGAAPGIKILNIRSFDPSGYGEEDDAAAAILYAVQMGAKIINMSFGDNSFSYVLRDVIRYAYARNVVLVASAGNSGTDRPHYPSGYSEVISVGNSTQNDFVSSGSNYGSTLDLVAPGTGIQTTAMNNSYSSVNGTSFSAPFVAAAAALVLSRGNYTNDEIRQILKSTTDNLGTPGWDLRSGAGRLNILKALSVTAPAVIRFDYPYQDFGTLKDTLNIKATVLSPYFLRYELSLGRGITPQTWNILTSGQNQFTSSDIYNLSVSNLPDSVYTLRLVVYQSNGRTTEERLNFHIARTPPDAELVTIGPALYGNESTVLASVYTGVPSTVKMYYRKYQASEEFRFVTLDGFSTNNQFVKYLHYGFIPKELIEPDAVYEIYLEAENLTGLKTVIRDGANNWLIRLSFNSDIASEFELPYSLPFGQLFEKPVNITSGDSTEVLFNGLYPGLDFHYGIYKLDGDSFSTALDSIKNRIPRDAGDFNSNGKTDILSTFERRGFIDEQISSGSAAFVNRMTDSSGAFWASGAEDFDGDGISEIMVYSSDTTISVWKLNSSLQKTDSVKLQNFTKKWYGGNRFNFPKVITADLDSDGKKEIWAVDTDGDILAYEFNGNRFDSLFSLSTALFGSSEHLASGDFNGDGKQDIAVLLRSIGSLYIAPFNLLLVFDREGILFEQAFVDPSAEFNTNFKTVWNSIKLVDIDNDEKDELITFSFPYAYIFKHTADEVKIISYKENVNSRSVFAADLNKNGVKEIAFAFPDGIRFYEFAVSNKASVPTHLTGFSADSSQTELSWRGNGDKFIIYRGTGKENLALYDSTVNHTYSDMAVENRKSYYYAVQAVDYQKPDIYSNISNIISVYIHNTSRIAFVENKSRNSVVVHFTERINTTVLDLQSFFIEGAGYPGSVSPATQFSYLLTFKSNLSVGENTLKIRNLYDNYSSPVRNEDYIFNVEPIITREQFYITTHKILNPYTIKIVFNFEVDNNSAANILNYTFEPENEVSRIEIDNNDRKIVYVHLEKKKPVGAIGIQYKLQIRDIYDASGLLKINDGAGSSIVLTEFAENLSNVYVYPNPYRDGGEQKITFAGLPLKAKINIFSLTGESIAEIEENNGDGGLIYDLKDRSGNTLGSGVYIYRIIRLDALNNEVEEKLGKFAVIR
jgi:subtilisin family serine protease